jgi:hypothetical protein
MENIRKEVIIVMPGGQAFVLPYTKTLVWIPTFQFKMRTPKFHKRPKRNSTRRRNTN